MSDEKFLPSFDHCGGRFHKAVILIAAAVSLAAMIALLAVLIFDEGDDYEEVVIEDGGMSEEVVVDEGDGAYVTVMDDEIEIVVDWIPLDEQREVTMNQVFLEMVYAKDLENIEAGRGDTFSASTFHLGSVAGGDYDGWSFQFIETASLGMGTYYGAHYILADPTSGALVWLGNYDRSMVSMFTSPLSTYTERDATYYEDFVSDWAVVFSNAVVDELEFEDLIFEDGTPLVVRGGSHHVLYEQSFLPADGEVMYLEDGSEIMYNPQTEGDDKTSEDFYFYRVREDGIVVWYDMEVPFWDYEARYEAGRVPAVTWGDGSVNTASYLRGVPGGCGTRSDIHLIDDEDIPELVAAGTFVDFDGSEGVVYEHAAYDEENQSYNFRMWQIVYPDASWEEFVVSHPSFYYEDSLGRWNLFTSVNIAPAAECGKPVIYLYPEEPTEMLVEVFPKGGFTFTEPDYGDGWNVMAYPDGTVVDLRDGEEYPYLFWEGRGGMYAEPEHYWAVPQQRVGSFLWYSLHHLGLNDQESLDFMEFWLPRMEDAEWYKIGFHGTEVMDVLAPLNISEEPDMVWRILMDFEELDEEIPSNPMEWPDVPEREGFTVIEWGGVIQ